MSTNTLTTVTTATIEPGTAGAQYLLVAVDGDPHCWQINTHHIALYGGRVTLLDEAARLLRRCAGYEPAGEWRETKPGTYVVDVVVVPGRCLTCVHGCGCRVGRRGCGHYGCAASPTDAAVANSCPGAAVHVAARRPSRRKTRASR